jgi:hypothetical protein
MLFTLGLSIIQKTVARSRLYPYLRTKKLRTCEALPWAPLKALAPSKKFCHNGGMPKKKTTKSTSKNVTYCCCDHPNPMHRVTSFSKVTAAVLFVSLPFIAFMLGTMFQQTVDAAYCSEIAAYF